MYYLVQEWRTVTTALSYERYQNFTRELLKKWHLFPSDILFSFHDTVSPETASFILKLFFSTTCTNKVLEMYFC
jgi:hypothetical protein